MVKKKKRLDTKTIIIIVVIVLIGLLVWAMVAQKTANDEDGFEAIGPGVGRIEPIEPEPIIEGCLEENEKCAGLDPLDLDLPCCKSSKEGKDLLCRIISGQKKISGFCEYCSSLDTECDQSGDCCSSNCFEGFCKPYKL